MNNEALQPGSIATPFSTAALAGLSGDWATFEAQYSDDIEWDLMSVDQILRGKEEVIPWLKTAMVASQKEPVVISDLATKEWGVFEYWNIGTISEDIVELAKQSEWLRSGLFGRSELNSLVGRKYKMPVCFVYHINAEGKIDLVREYLDVGSSWLSLNK